MAGSGHTGTLERHDTQLQSQLHSAAIRSAYAPRVFNDAGVNNAQTLSTRPGVVLIASHALAPGRPATTRECQRFQEGLQIRDINYSAVSLHAIWLQH
jgi:hypothetical protein